MQSYQTAGVRFFAYQGGGYTHMPPTYVLALQEVNSNLDPQTWARLRNALIQTYSSQGTVNSGPDFFNVQVLPSGSFDQFVQSSGQVISSILGVPSNTIPSNQPIYVNW
jgi:hypothetical protein